MSAAEYLFCGDCEFDIPWDDYRELVLTRKFSEEDVKNGLPEFYLRTDEDIINEVINKPWVKFSFQFNVHHYYPDSVFKEHEADPREEKWVPKIYQERCWEVWNRIRRLCEIKVHEETLFFWGLNVYEAEALAKIEFQYDGFPWPDLVLRVRGITEEELTNLTTSEISERCKVDTARAEEIWNIFQPMRGKFKFDYHDDSAEKMDWLENSYRPWKSEMQKKEYLANIPPEFDEYAEKASAWAISLGLDKITSPEFNLFLFEEEINLIGANRKHLLKMSNDLI